MPLAVIRRVRLVTAALRNDKIVRHADTGGFSMAGSLRQEVALGLADPSEVV
jgi:hypothetical protein